jgi:anti-sigma factor RsiW
VTVNPLLAQALAYADGCLAADQRQAFERALAADPDLAARVAQWRMQNEAIRIAFTRTAPTERRRDDGEGEGHAAAKPSELPSPRRAFGRAMQREEERREATQEFARRSPLGRIGRLALVLSVAAAAWVLTVVPAPVDGSSQLGRAAFSAYRTYSGGAPLAEFDFATSEPVAMARFFRRKLGGWVAVPDLSAAGFKPVGGWVFPGPRGPAVFALYRSGAGARIGLALQAGEAAGEPTLRGSGAVVGRGLAAPDGEEAALVAAAAAADLDRVARLARFDAASQSPGP